MRSDGRSGLEVRPVSLERGFVKHAEGSALISVGDTRVICTVSVEDKVPHFLRGTGQGWITAEYSMLPRATETRSQREVSKGRQGGRTMEIQRLIGRALRAVVDLRGLGERTLWIDCDVIQADGGTRTAAISGSFVAVVDAVRHLRRRGMIKGFPVRDFLAATSVGLIGDEILLDLRYSEDSVAAVDMNVVMTGAMRLVEVQGMGEAATFTREQMLAMLDAAQRGIDVLMEAQRAALGEDGNEIGGGNRVG